MESEVFGDIVFADDLVDDVISGDKEATIRRSSYSDVSIGDVLVAKNTNREEFCKLRINQIAFVDAIEAHDILKSLGVSYSSDKPEDVLDILDTYYSNITPKTDVNILVFEVID